MQVQRRCGALTWRASAAAAAPPAATLWCSFRRVATRGGRRHHSSYGAASHRPLRPAESADTSPRTSLRSHALPAIPRRVPRRPSLLAQLREEVDTPDPSASGTDYAPALATLDPSPAPDASAHVPHGPATLESPYITSSHFATAAHHAAASATASALPPPSASAELHQQHRALREAFAHARRHHNVRLAKDPRVYRAECRAFRQAHNGRAPTPQEVPRTVAVPLAPVAALKTLAHTQRSTSSLHAVTAAAVQLHNAVAKNELVKSNAPQLVRCLRCFHVYTARPRTLWGGEVGQSGIEHEKAQAAQRRQQPLRPGQRRQSVGQRRRAEADNPACCPECQSPRAQWMMEYVHHHTHERT